MISNATEAARIIQQHLNNIGINLDWKYTHQTSEGSHIELVEIKTGIVHHIKFTNEMLYAFGSFFPEWRGEKGETLDEEIIDRLKPNDLLYFSHPEKILFCTLEEFVKPNLWRHTNAGVKTCCFPVCCLTEMEF